MNPLGPSGCKPAALSRLSYRPMNTCLHCGRETVNQKFCSRSCAVSYNNKRSPKRKLTKQCKKCGALIHSSRTYCPECIPAWNKNDCTLAEVQQNAGSRNSYASIVHQRARAAAKKAKLLNECKVCGYSNHVACCHIRPVSEFSLDTSLSVVNDLSNLVGLCPNHHWELDHGLLELPDLTSTR